jgi:hypothetical protein
VDGIDAAAVAFYQKFLEPPKVPLGSPSLHLTTNLAIC